MTEVVYSLTEPQYLACEELAGAVEAFNTACRKVQDEASANLSAVARSVHHAGFSHQTLVTCATSQERYERALQACRRLNLSDPITVLVTRPALIHSAQFKRIS